MVEYTAKGMSAARQSCEQGSTMGQDGYSTTVTPPLGSDPLRPKDTAEQAEKEEAVFTSGTIIGSESFIRKIVAREEEAFPTGHKTPPVDFGVGGITLKTLRNIGILR